MKPLQTLARYLKQHWRFLAACLATALFAAIGFFAVTVAVRADLLRSLDFALTVKIQGKVPPKVDELLIMLGGFASFQVIVPALLLFLFVMRRWIMVVTSLGLLFVAHLLEIVGKEILFQPPPPFMFYRHPTDFVFPELHTFDVSSYPSGHSLRVTFMAITVAAVLWTSPKIPRWLTLVCIGAVSGYSVVVMVSKVSLGEHWSSDVLGGFFLGLMIAALNVMVILWKRTPIKKFHSNHV